MQTSVIQPPCGFISCCFAGMACVHRPGGVNSPSPGPERFLSSLTSQPFRSRLLSNPSRTPKILSVWFHLFEGTEFWSPLPIPCFSSCVGLWCEGCRASRASQAGWPVGGSKFLEPLRVHVRPMGSAISL